LSLIVATETYEPDTWNPGGGDVLRFYWDDGTYLHDLGGWLFDLPVRTLVPGFSDYVDTLIARAMRSAENAELDGLKF